MSEREELEKAITLLDGQRAALGHAAVEAALLGVQQRLSALDEGQSLSAEELITRLIPESLAAKMRATRQVEGERRQVTVLFADLSDYTSMSERLDPEIVMALSQDLLRELTESVYEHEGYVVQFMGDSVMAVFGAPITHEDDAERAVHAALAMRERVEQLSRRWLEQLGQPLVLHTGINTGTAVTGSVGSDLRMAYAVIGDTTNTAQRLQSVAAPGEIVVSHETFLLADDAFTHIPLEPITVKGKRHAMRAYRVVGVKAGPSHGRGLAAYGLVSPLVGRQREFDMLQSSLGRLLERGEGGIVTVIGEAGLGKSRLLAECKSSAAAHGSGVLWLEGQTLSFGRTISYWPFQQILRSLAGISEDDDSDTSWRKLENQVRGLFGEETIDYLPYLASLLALEVRSQYADRVKYLDGDAMGKQIFLTVRRFFERLARTRPTVLVFEDIHWMDASSTNLLEHLLPLVEQVPVLIVGLGRPERDTTAARLRERLLRDFAAHYTEILLAPLSQQDSTELMRNLLTIEDIPAHVRARIVDRAEGNPFYLEEVLRTLIATDAVRQDVGTGKWRATAGIESIHIPNTIQGVIIARVDRLDDEVKQVLRIASVIGRSFLYRVLHALTEAGHRLDHHLTELQATELIREKRHVPELEYMFRHAVAQEATYESILLQKRRDLHAQVAKAVESQFTDRLEEFYGLLAYHYARAEIPDKLREYLLKAADQAGGLAADTEAITLYEQAIAAYARAFGDNWDPVQRAAVERKLADARLRLGQHTQALEHYYRALDYLGTPLPRSRQRQRLALLRELAHQATRRLLSRELVKRSAAPVEPAFEQEVSCCYGICLILAFSNPEGYLLSGIRTLNRAEHKGLPYGVIISTGYSGLANTLDFVPGYALAGYYLRRALALAQLVQHPRATDFAHSMMGIHEFILGNPSTALEHSMQAVAATQESGELYRWAFVTMNIVQELVYLGDLQQAVERGNVLLRTAHDAGDQHAACFGEMGLGMAWKRLGRLDEAHAHLRQAVALAEQIPDYYSGILSSGELAQCLARQGQFSAALEALEVGLQFRSRFKFGGNCYSHLVHGQAECYLSQAERATGSERADWLGKAGSACKAALKYVGAFRPGAAEAMLLQGRYEWLRANPKAARTWWMKSLAEAERMALRYHAAMTHLEIGQRLGEREHLEAARTMLAGLGVKEA